MEFLLDLRNRGITITLNGERLKLNAPKGFLTPEIKNDLSVRRGEILQILKKAQQLENKSKDDRIELLTRNNHLPLSIGQERIWLLNESNPNSNTFHIPIIWKLVGAIKPEQLQFAWDQYACRQVFWSNASLHV